MSRHDDAFEIRKKAAKLAHDRDFAKTHPYNGEEDKYKDLDGNRNIILSSQSSAINCEMAVSSRGYVIASTLGVLNGAEKNTISLLHHSNQNIPIILNEGGGKKI